MWSVTFMYTCYGNCFEFDTKAIGGKVFQNVVPAAALGHTLLTSLPSDSQASRSLTWVVADFHSIVPGLPYPAILFPVQSRKSCLQLFPALWTKELLQAQTHTPKHTYNSIHTSSSFTLPLSLSSGCPSLMWRWPQGMMGWSQKHVLLSFSRQNPCLYVRFTCATVFLKGYCNTQVILYKLKHGKSLWL